MTSEALLTAEALSKSVPGPRLLFEGLDLNVGAGEVVAIIGDSGVGKSPSGHQR